MDPFLGDWTIDNWELGPPVPGEIPANGFKIGGPLTITGHDPNGSSVDLFWHNDDDHDCSAFGLQYREAFNQLEGQSIAANFAGQSVPCDFTVDLDPNDSSQLTLTIQFASKDGPFPEVGSGVVTATATPP